MTTLNVFLLSRACSDDIKPYMILEQNFVKISNLLGKWCEFHIHSSNDNKCMFNHVQKHCCKQVKKL